MKLELTKEQVFNLITLITQELTGYDYIDPKKEFALERRGKLEQIRNYLKTLLPETYKNK